VRVNSQVIPNLEIRPLLPDEWRLLKSLRLRALADAPEAFGTTLAEAQAWPEEDWQERARRFAASPPATMCIAYQNGLPCGMVSCYLSETNSMADQRVAELTAFWVAPESRGQGVGEALVSSVTDWATAQGVRVLQAWVTEGNERAVAFYKKTGFWATGQRQLYAPDPVKHIVLLARLLEPRLRDRKVRVLL